MAKCVWALVDDQITKHLGATVEPSAKQWLFAMLESLKHEDFIKMVVTLWPIWHARRKATHENIFQSPISTFSFVERFLQDLVPLDAPAPSAPRTKLETPRWLPPLQGSIKINVDAAVAKTAALGSVAAIAQDANGLFQGASAVTVGGIVNPATLEAMACREALALVADLGARRLMIGSDCQEVVTAINGRSLNYFVQITREIQHISKSFSVCVFRHESRSSNMDAHKLARSTSSLDVGRRVWFSHPSHGLCIPSQIVP